MNHWVSQDGGAWAGPTQLPNGNVVASVPCAIALPNGSVHVFAIANGGGLAHWSSPDGNAWTHQVDQAVPIPGGWNGLAVASSGGQRLDVFATTQAGIIHFTYDRNHASRRPLSGRGGLPVQATFTAVSPASGQLNVFALDPNIRMPVRWHFNGTSGRSRCSTARHCAASRTAGSRPRSSRQSAASSCSRFADDGKLTNWSIAGWNYTEQKLDSGAETFPDGVPRGVVVSPSRTAAPAQLDVSLGHGRGRTFNGGCARGLAVRRLVEPGARATTHRLAAGGVGAIDADGRGNRRRSALRSRGRTTRSSTGPAASPASPETGGRTGQATSGTDSPEGPLLSHAVEELVAIVKTAPPWPGQAGARRREQLVVHRHRRDARLRGGDQPAQQAHP